jgi:hypothetical protein
MLEIIRAYGQERLTEAAEHGPGADGEVDPVERDRVPVPLDQPFGMYGVSHAATLPPRPNTPPRSR